jgi:Domain of unknown function (DUF4189)
MTIMSPTQNQTSHSVRAGLRMLAVIMVASTGHSSHTVAAGAFASAREGQRTWGGFTYNATTYDEAQKRALEKCSLHGPGCHIVAFFSLRCLAVAVQHGTGGTSWAVGATTQEAQEFVMNQCRSFGRPCELKGAVCDSVGLPGSEIPVNAPAPSPRPAPTGSPGPAPTPSTARPRGCDLYPELC